jgi:hypothetical protein
MSAVRKKLLAILYKPIVGHSIQYFDHATISLCRFPSRGPQRSTVNLLG